MKRMPGRRTGAPNFSNEELEFYGMYLQDHPAITMTDWTGVAEAGRKAGFPERNARNLKAKVSY